MRLPGSPDTAQPPSRPRVLLELLASVEVNAVGGASFDDVGVYVDHPSSDLPRTQIRHPSRRLFLNPQR